MGSSFTTTSDLSQESYTPQFNYTNSSEQQEGLFVFIDVEHTGKKLASVGIAVTEGKQENVFLQEEHIILPNRKEDFDEDTLKEFWLRDSHMRAQYEQLLNSTTTNEEAGRRLTEVIDNISLNNADKCITFMSDNPVMDVKEIDDFLVKGGFRPKGLSHRAVRKSDGSIGYEWNTAVKNPDDMFLAFCQNPHKRWGFGATMNEVFGLQPVTNPNPHNALSDAKTNANEFIRARNAWKVVLPLLEEAFNLYEKRFGQV